MSQNYKQTLNLPKTDFPMKANLAAREPELLKMWEETRLYEQIQKSRADRQLFVLHDGPPLAQDYVHICTGTSTRLRRYARVEQAKQNQIDTIEHHISTFYTSATRS